MKTPKQIPSLIAVAVIGLCLTAPTSHAQSLRASDNADNYPGGWTNGSNGGTGFGPWVFEIIQSTANGSYAGTFLGDPANALITGMGTNAFGLYANTGSSFVEAVAKVTRPIPVPLQIGEKLRFKWGINWDGDRANGNKGFNLYVSNTEVINVNNAGGNSTITFNGLDTGFGYGTQAMIWTFERLNATTLRVTANDRDGTGQFSMDFNTGDIEALGVTAGIHRKVFRGFHRALSKKFPVAIFYTVDGGVVRIRSVVDCRRKPSWIRGHLRQA